jgi:hypothetical protein
VRGKARSVKNFRLTKNGEVVGEGTMFEGGVMAVYWKNTKKTAWWSSMELLLHRLPGTSFTYLEHPATDTYRVYLSGAREAHLVAREQGWITAPGICGDKPRPGDKWNGSQDEHHVRYAQNLPLCLTCANNRV